MFFAVAICAGCAEAKQGDNLDELMVNMLQFARDVLRQSYILRGECRGRALQFARDMLRQSFRCSDITDRFRVVFLHTESCWQNAWLESESKTPCKNIKVLQGAISLFSADLYFNIACIGVNLASAAGYGLGNIDIPRVGLRDKYLIGKQVAGHIACTGFDENISSIRAVKFHIAGGSFNGKFFRGNHMTQKNIACGPAG